MAIAVGELWNYFANHRSELKDNLHMVASNEDKGVEIYLTEERGFPYFSVEVNGEEVFGAGTISSLDAENTYRDLLRMFVIYTDKQDDDADDSAGENSDGFEDEGVNDDDIRVNDITRAVEEMLSVLLEEDPYEAGLSPQEVDEIASVVEQYLYDNSGFSVRHPTLLDDGMVIQYPFGDPIGEELEVP